MKMMKKWLSLLLCGALLLSTGGLFAACGKQTDDGTTNATDTAKSQVTLRLQGRNRRECDCRDGGQ